MQSLVLPDAQLGQAPVEALQQHTGLAEGLAGDVAAAAARPLDRHLHRLLDGQVLPGVEHGHDGAGPHALQVLEEGSGVAAVGVGRVDALGGEVVELLEVGVQHDLLLVGVLEGLAAGQHALAAAAGGDGGAAAQAGDVPPQHVHQHRLRQVVRVVALRRSEGGDRSTTL